MSETWYKTTPTWSSAYQIYPVEIERHTELSVLHGKGRAQRKETTYECFYPTWESAKAAIVAEQRVEDSYRSIGPGSRHQRA